jgi:muconolactone delta-isomerase
MRILAMEQSIEGVDDQRCGPWLRAESARVWDLYQQGVIRELYFRPDTHQAVLLLECHDIEECRGALASLPLVQQGCIAFDIIPLVPYSGFARLFSTPLSQ